MTAVIISADAIVLVQLIMTFSVKIPTFSIRAGFYDPWVAVELQNKT